MLEYDALTTIGPEGTDAQFLANNIAQRVLLKDNFREALELTVEQNIPALIPCGAVRSHNYQSGENWVDLNFEYSEQLKIERSFVQPTKPICVAVNSEKGEYKSIGLHPATEYFALTNFSDSKKIYFVNKVDAVHACFVGRVEACIGSEDIIQKYPSLKIISRHQPSMVWVIYSKH